MVGAGGIENNADRNFKDLEEMLGSAKELKRNNRECKGILIGPSFFSTIEISSQCISLTGQVAQSALGSTFAARMASRRNFVNMLDRPRSVAGASLVRDFFDFVETSQDPDVDGTTHYKRAPLWCRF